jgi:hypothetical protein
VKVLDRLFGREYAFHGRANLVMAVVLGCVALLLFDFLVLDRVETHAQCESHYDLPFFLVLLVGEGLLVLRGFCWRRRILSDLLSIRNDPGVDIHRIVSVIVSTWLTFLALLFSLMLTAMMYADRRTESSSSWFCASALRPAALAFRANVA